MVKKILKLDIAKQSGWAITDELWYKNHGKIYASGTEIFWKQKPILYGNRVDLMFHFILELSEKYEFDEIWYEELNSVRNLDTVKSLMIQQAGVHLAALKLNIPIKSIKTSESYRKKVAVNKLLQRTILVQTDDEADALLLGEGRKT